jgi:hypothetical protein
MSDVPAVAMRRLRVFLCHAAADKPAVRELYLRLQQDGFQPWLDEKNLLPGQEWEQAIRQAVRESDVVLVCLSPIAATKRGFVQKEIKFALDVSDEQPEGVIFIIPLKLEECAVPERLSRWHWLDYFEVDRFANLARALRARAGSLGLAIPSGTIKINRQDGLEYVWIPPGEFHMGDLNGNSDEKPQHIVCIDHGFVAREDAGDSGGV